MIKKPKIILEKLLPTKSNLKPKNLAKKTSTELWEEKNKKAIEEYNKDVDKNGLILQNSRIF